jgi:hypothetical protein
VSQLSVNTITNAAGGNTAQINGMTPTADSLQGFRNRIINGDMRIDQRNAGASVTINSTAATYTLDRFNSTGEATDGVFSIQRSTTAPSGFTNSLIATVTTADASIGSTQRYLVQQRIEGFNVADLGWGTASAQSVTLSFWVRSSVTGTFGGSFRNSAGDRSYPFTYTISAANTFEYKTITVAGDTTGTWATDNAAGIYVSFSMGAGSSLKTTAGAWAAGSFWAGTGSVDLIATSGATFYITGVQLEAGSVATPFERRPFGTELALCQRYYQKSFPQATAPVNNSGFAYIQTTLKYGSANAEPQVQIVFPVAMRAAPSATLYNPFTGTAAQWTDGISVSANARALNMSEFGMQIDNTDVVLNWDSAASIAYAVAAEL